jgi:uncharacterized iron-regulated membrane protein
MVRNALVRLHRWAGLVMAAFLLVVGLTGSALVFWQELNEWLAPSLYPGLRAGTPLAAAALAERAEAIEPAIRATTVYLGYPGTVWVGVEPRPGGPPVDYDYIYLDPLTGAELGRVRWGAWPTSFATVMPFIYELHETLVLGATGERILGLVALLWTVDCFVAFVLTLPRSSPSSTRSWLARWRPAWLVKLGAPPFRLTYDLHRAGGLWPWALMLVFAWSSVFLNLGDVYTAVTSRMLDYAPSPAGMTRSVDAGAPAEPMPWAAAQATGERLMAAQEYGQGFTAQQPMALYLLRSRGLYEYRVRSTRDITDKYGSTSVYFDAATGALQLVRLPTGQRAGNTLTTWLLALHMANVFGWPFRVFVSLAGVVLAMLSVTGVVIWWMKRQARRVHRLA